MIVKIVLQLDLPADLRTHNIGSLLHGVIMERLHPETASMLHQYRYNPLKQRLYFEGEHTFWEVVSLEGRLSEELLIVFEGLEQIMLRHRQKGVSILGVVMERIELGDFVKVAMEVEARRYVKLRVLTPMSFKVDGNYGIFPDVRMMIRSVMLTFDYFSEDMKLYDYETLDFLAENVRIVDYNLRSTRFELERVKIPAFRGSMTLRVDGNAQIQSLVNLIFAYGELSGIGIKTSMGMGGVKRG